MSFKRRQDEYLLTLPPFLWLTLFFLIPAFFVFSYSFKSFDGYGAIGEAWTLETFRSLGTKSYFLVAWRTLWISVLTTAITFALALPVSYTIARASSRVKNLLLLLTILPFWSSFIVRIFAWKTLLNPEGFLKKLLVSLYLVSPDAQLLYNTPTVIIVMVYTFIPFAVFPLYAAAAKFDFTLLEAAYDLGMSRFRTFFKVFVPGIRAGVVASLLIVFIPALGSYVIPDILGGPRSELVGNKIVQRTFTERNLPEASALATLLALAVIAPIGVVTILQGQIKKRKTLRAKL